MSGLTAQREQGANGDENAAADLIEAPTDPAQPGADAFSHAGNDQFRDRFDRQREVNATPERQARQGKRRQAISRRIATRAMS